MPTLAEDWAVGDVGEFEPRLEGGNRGALGRAPGRFRPYDSRSPVGMMTSSQVSSPYHSLTRFPWQRRELGQATETARDVPDLAVIGSGIKRGSQKVGGPPLISTVPHSGQGCW